MSILSRFRSFVYSCIGLGRSKAFSTVAQMDAFEKVLAGNKAYAQHTAKKDPELMKSLAAGQSPEILWIGCADSRIPETTICQCKPGELFVHRNIANVLTPGDANSSSVIEYSVGVLKVKRIIVCGHTKCGGANAAMGDGDLGDTLNSWLAPVRELRRKHIDELSKLPSEDAKANRLAELNVEHSLEILRKNPTVQKAIRERDLKLHGMIYDIPAAELRSMDIPEPKQLWSPPTLHR
ncbi:carbonic anhydrase [Aulographum hederae CBS 113979]|uniref:Carbonic anhydrase n=1 Tax=Aulographum hederae CBS 113979 TaxID=1176131 RepID=A0A6G1HFF4_9PEZI|nr:carbonic anhydrase [Aulographum hederae CBS 113979]